MLLVPRPPEFMTEPVLQSKGKKFDPAETEDAEMKVLAPGADALPAKDDSHSTKKHFRLITVGKKKLPDPKSPGAEGSKRNELFWASVTAVGDDLESLENGLEEKSYETKTRGLVIVYLPPRQRLTFRQELAIKEPHALSRGVDMRLSTQKGKLLQVERPILVTISLIQAQQIWEKFNHLWASIPPLLSFFR